MSIVIAVSTTFSPRFLQCFSKSSTRFKISLALLQDSRTFHQDFFSASPRFPEHFTKISSSPRFLRRFPGFLQSFSKISATFFSILQCFSSHPPSISAMVQVKRGSGFITFLDPADHASPRFRQHFSGASPRVL